MANAETNRDTDAEVSAEMSIIDQLRESAIRLFNSRPLTVDPWKTDIYVKEDAAKDAIHKLQTESGVTPYTIFAAIIEDSLLNPSELIETRGTETGGTWLDWVNDVNQQVVTEALNDSGIEREDTRRYRVREVLEEFGEELKTAEETQIEETN